MKAGWVHSTSVACAVLALAGTTALASTTLYSNDFGANDGGFTVGSLGTMQPSDQPWTWSVSSGSWATGGPTGVNGFPPRASVLQSPVIPVNDNGTVYLAFTHRWAFEYGPDPRDGVWRYWDGGQLRVSINGGPMQEVTDGSFVVYGYNATIDAGPGNNWLNGQRAYGAASPGYYSNESITSVVNLGDRHTGDTIQLNWVASWDWYMAAASPNWQLDGLDMQQVPEPATLAMLGAGALFLWRARRQERAV
jgi:hypothetical protein